MTASPLAVTPASARAEPTRPVFLPKEHGSWSLAFEPLALGLIVAPSAGGLPLAVATSAAFFSRRPLGAFLKADSTSPRASRRLMALLLVCAGAGLGEAAILGGTAAMWPLLICAPLVALFLYSDWRGESRAAESELAGSAAFAVLPVSFATLAGWSPKTALSLGAIMAARSLPAVIAVRCAVRIGKRRATRRLAPVAAAAAGFVLLAVLAARNLIPVLTVGMGGVLAVCTAAMLVPRRVPFTPRKIGTIEAVLGVLYVLGSAYGYGF